MTCVDKKVPLKSNDRRRNMRLNNEEEIQMDFMQMIEKIKTERYGADDRGTRQRPAEYWDGWKILAAYILIRDLAATPEKTGSRSRTIRWRHFFPDGRCDFTRGHRQHAHRHGKREESEGGPCRSRLPRSRKPWAGCRRIISTAPYWLPTPCAKR